MTMVNDATEAALGLLGLTGSIDFSTTPTIPLKRKTSTTFSLPPPNDDPDSSANNSDSINCICGYTYDDGFSVACDDCSRWVHAACFDISEGEVPEEWRCWVCQPRKVDRERAVKIQRVRQKKIQEEAEAEKQRRRVSSPGVDRKRRASAAAIDGSSNAKRKRRYSVTTQQLGQQQQQQLERQQLSTIHPPPPPPQPHHRHQSPVEDEHIDIDEPAMHSYVHVEKDLVPHQHTRDKLKRLAQHWRGMTALDTSLDDPSLPVLLTPDEIPTTPQTSLHPLPRSSYSHPTLSSHMNPSVRPPSYTVRTTQPILGSSLIAPYTSTITPSTVYLSDPLNSYAHLGMPKPFVHLIGPPLDLALDARLAGNGARFVRSGCRPNAVLRPMLCRRSHGGNTNGCPSDDTLTFGVFALRDLKAHEEVVLGWEWDDGSVIHHLPALIDSPHLFAPPRFQQFRYQMTSMLHALSSTFTTCACGAKTRDCALNRLAEFVDGQTPPTPSPSPPSLHVDDPLKRTDSQSEEQGRGSKADLGPLVGVERGFRTRERVPMSGGMSGVEMVDDKRHRHSAWSSEHYPEAGPSRLPPSRESSPPAPVSKRRDRKGKGRATDDEMGADNARSRGEKAHRSSKKSSSTRKSVIAKATSSISPSLSSSSSHRSLPVPKFVPESEDKLPPKFRKKWIHKSADMLSETTGTSLVPEPPPPKPHEQVEVMEVDGSLDDPKAVPPFPSAVHDGPSKVESLEFPFTQSTPLPTPTLPPQDPTSPSTSFANLSLLSPLVDGPPAYSQNRAASPIPEPSRPELPDEDYTMKQEPEPSTLPESHSNPLRQTTSLPMGTFSNKDAPEGIAIVARPSASEPPAPRAESAPSMPSDEHSNVADGEQCRDGATNSQDPAQSLPTQDIQQAANDWQLSGGVWAQRDWNDMSPPARSADEREEDRPMADVAVSRVEEPPPTKVKLSLKDFAMRKRKQREEESKAPWTVLPDGPDVRPAPQQEGALPTYIPLEVPPSEQPAMPASTGTEDRKLSVPEHIPDSMSAPNIRLVIPDSLHPPQQQHDASPEPNSVMGRTGMDEPQSMSLGTKVELVEARLPSPPLPSHHPGSPPVTLVTTVDPPQIDPQINQENAEPITSIRSLSIPSIAQSQHGLARQISREDGEIFSPPPPKPTPLAPRAYSPPTRPRSFHPQPDSTSPSRPPPQPPRRPLQPAHRSHVQNGPSNPRPPSGPRALRALGSSSGGNHYSPFSGAPRAPSADRDRDHRMDWDRDRPRGGSWGRGRGAPNGWSR